MIEVMETLLLMPTCVLHRQRSMPVWAIHNRAAAPLLVRAPSAAVARYGVRSQLL
eukprot:COSAG01_NODE_3285_length_6309_cov_2.105153_7_plen_55_part_00